jgi:hypothetical protein
LFGISLLLFFEDFAAETLVAFLVSLREVRARLLVALRLTAAAFLEAFDIEALEAEGLDTEALDTEALETLFLRVFCDTACARNCHAPVGCFHGNP